MRLGGRRDLWFCGCPLFSLAGMELPQPPLAGCAQAVRLAPGLRCARSVDHPRPFCVPSPGRVVCLYLSEWSMAVLRACFAVGCCLLAGGLLVAHFSLDMEYFLQPRGKQYLVLLIIRCSLGSPHSGHTAEVQRYLGWLFKSTFIAQSLGCVLSLNPCAAFLYPEWTRVCHLSKIFGQTVSAVSNLRELLI